MSTQGSILTVKKFEIHDGDGLRSTLFLKGCPLRCRWCHNPEGISPQPQLAYYAPKCIGCGSCTTACPAGCHLMEGTIHRLDRRRCTACGACAEVCPKGALTLFGRRVTVEDILPELLADRAFYDATGGGVTLSGGEPLMQASFCRELLERLKKEDIRTAVDTCGYASRQAVEAVMPYTDVFLYDLKAVDEEVHKRCTGVSNRPILENLRYINSRGKNVEIRIPYVPGMNDGEIERMGEFLQDLSAVRCVKVLPYHGFAASKYEALGMENPLPRTESPGDEVLAQAVARLRSFGLNAVSGRD